MSHPSQYNNPSFMPSGFDTMKSKIKGLCWYTANHGGNNPLCNVPENTHAWLSPAQNPAANKFLCGKVSGGGGGGSDGSGPRQFFQIGSSGTCTKCVSGNFDPSTTCPEISKCNWEGGAQHGDRFQVTVSANKVCVKRLDYCPGWGMNLHFYCGG